MTLRILTIFGLSMCLVACDSDDSGDSNPGSTGSSSAAEGNFVSAPDDGCLSMQIGEADVPHMGPGAGISGLVVDNQCNPLSGFKVLCCTDESCVPTDTLADGTFYLGGIMNEIPRKVRIVGVTQGYYDALIYLAVSGDSLTVASKPIVLAPLSDYVTLGVEAGGTATIFRFVLDTHGDEFAAVVEDGLELAVDDVQLRQRRAAHAVDHRHD